MGTDSPWSRRKITRTKTSRQFSLLNVVATTSNSSKDRFLAIGGLGSTSWGDRCKKILEAKKYHSGEWSVDSVTTKGPEPGCRTGHAGVRVGKFFVMNGGRTVSSNAAECVDSSLYTLHLREYPLRRVQDSILTKGKNPSHGESLHF